MRHSSPDRPHFGPALLLTLLVCLHTLPRVGAQGSSLPAEDPAYPILDRLEIKSGLPPPYHSAVKPFFRSDIGRYANQLDTADLPLSLEDRLDIFYLFRENNEWLGQAPYATTLFGRSVPVWPDSQKTQIEASLEDPHYFQRPPLLGIFYPSPANFLELNNRFLHLRVNPVIGLRGGRDWENGRWVMEFPRGLTIRGGVDDRIYFYTEILETQAFLPRYVLDFEEKFEAIPGQGLYKVPDSEGPNGRLYDYLNGQGYLGFHISRHVGLQFGYGRQFVGNGYRSLFLSDFSNNRLFLRLHWQVWKLTYQNIFAELTTQSVNANPVNQLVPKKWIAAHYLSLRLSPNLTVGLFESVVFSRSNGFELQFLNPLILYRTVEQAIGSPDNVSLGIDLKWNFLRHFQLYGQFFIDEFVFRELVTDNRGWWGNKNAFQLGLKYINAFGLEHLDLQAEYNSIRPYTYSFRDSSGNYSHQNQSLAHPLGANLRELIFRLRWQPGRRWIVGGRLVYVRSGADPDSLNYGGNILRSSNTRVATYGNSIGQGIATQTLFGAFRLSYRLFHHAWIDLNYEYLNRNSAAPDRQRRFHFVGGGVRLNYFPRRGLY